MPVSVHVTFDYFGDYLDRDFEEANSLGLHLVGGQIYADDVTGIEHTPWSGVQTFFTDYEKPTDTKLSPLQSNNMFSLWKFRLTPSDADFAAEIETSELGLSVASVYELEDVAMLTYAPEMFTELKRLVTALEPMEHAEGLPVLGIATLNRARQIIAAVEAGTEKSQPLALDV